MPVRVPEVASVLALLLVLLIAKQIPFFDGLPIKNIMGIVSFSFAIFLSLRLFYFELARIRADDPPVAERFELYLGPLELANGYHELRDAAEQRARFERDQALRRVRGQPVPPLDEALLAALEHGLPSCAGVALGVDRLLMGLLGTDRIADVLAFDFARA